MHNNIQFTDMYVCMPYGWMDGCVYQCTRVCMSIAGMLPLSLSLSLSLSHAKVCPYLGRISGRLDSFIQVQLGLFWAASSWFTETW